MLATHLVIGKLILEVHDLLFDRVENIFLSRQKQQ